MINKNKNLTKILEPFQNQWVALNSKQTKVLANGKTLNAVAGKLSKKRKNVKDPFFMRVIQFDVIYSPVQI